MKNMQVRLCLNCGNEFSYNANTKREKNRKYCSSSCAKHCNGKNNLGRKHTLESSELKRQASLGEKNHFYGKTHSQSALQKMSNAHKGKNVGPEHYNWKGGVRKGHNGGYLRNTDGTFIHRTNLEKHLGRKLREDEVVHHIDEDVLNNEVSNLEIHSPSSHSKLHNQNRKRDQNGRFKKK